MFSSLKRVQLFFSIAYIQVDSEISILIMVDVLFWKVRNGFLTNGCACMTISRNFHVNWAQRWDLFHPVIKISILFVCSILQSILIWLIGIIKMNTFNWFSVLHVCGWLIFNLSWLKSNQRIIFFSFLFFCFLCFLCLLVVDSLAQHAHGTLVSIDHSVVFGAPTKLFGPVFLSVGNAFVLLVLYFKQ